MWLRVMGQRGASTLVEAEIYSGFGLRANMQVHNVTKEFLMERNERRKRNEWFWVKALDILSSLNTPLGVSVNVKVTSGCGQTA